jgi:hypothetical protein
MLQNIMSGRMLHYGDNTQITELKYKDLTAKEKGPISPSLRGFLWVVRPISEGKSTSLEGSGKSTDFDEIPKKGVTYLCLYGLRPIRMCLRM